MRFEVRSCLGRGCGRHTPTTRDQTAAYEGSILLGSGDRRQEVMSRIGLDDVTMGSHTQGVLGNLDRVMLTQKDYSSFRRYNADAACGLNAADPWQADVQEDDRRVKFPSLLHSLFAIRSLSYDIEIGITGKN